PGERWHVVEATQTRRRQRLREDAGRGGDELTELYERRAKALEPVDRAVRRRCEPGLAPRVGDLPDEAPGDGEGEHHIDDNQAQQLGDAELVDGRHVDLKV